MKNLIIDLLETADVFPDKVAIATEGGDITYAALRVEIVGAAANLRDAGITAGTGVALAIGHPIHALVAILAVGLIGARWIPLLGRGKGDILATLGVTYVVTQTEGSPETAVKFDERFKRVTLRRNVDPTLMKRYAPEISGRAPLDNTWYMAVTSGTTGTPKVMNLSYANYWARNKKAKLTHDFDPVITSNLFPPLSGPWVSYNLRTLALQGTLVMSRDFEFLIKKNVQKLFGSPAQYTSYLKAIPAGITGKLPIAHVAGATLSKEFAAQILQRFDIIHNFYGGTEVGGIARNVIRSAGDNLRCVGRILDGNSVEVVDANYQVVRVGTVGLIRVRNNIMVHAYANNEEASRECFKDGWFYSGDLGYFDQEGMLYVTGRSNDVINIGGVKVNPQIIDDVLMNCSSIAEALTFKAELGGRDRIAALVVPSKNATPEQLRSEISLAVNTQLPKHQRIAGVLYVNELPRNANGKPVRALAQKLSQGHKLYTVALEGKAQSETAPDRVLH